MYLRTLAPCLVACSLAAQRACPEVTPLSSPTATLGLAASAAGSNVGEGHMWLAEVSSTEITGGSLLSGHSSTLTAQAGATLTVVRDGNGDLPHVIVVEEALAGGGFVYHGLAADGSWEASAQQAQQATASHHGDQYTMLEIGGGAIDVIVFTPWELVGSGWDNLSSGGASQTIEANRYVATLSDGSQLVGYSPFAQNGPRPAVPAPSAFYVATNGTAERNNHTYRTSGRFQLFAANANKWLQFNTIGGSPSVDHSEMSTVIDEAGRIAFYSAMTGTVAQHVFSAPTLTQGGYVDLVEDTNQAVIHRVVDNGLLVFPYGSGQTSIVGHDFAGIVDGSSYEMVSGVVVAPPAVLTLPAGANEVARAQSDTVLLLETDEPAIYGYSSMLNAWVQTSVPAGFTVGSLSAEHSLGTVLFEQRDGSGTLLAQEAAAFAPRNGLWLSQPLSASAALDSNDGLWVARDSGSLYTVGTESLAWQSSALPAGTAVTDGSTGDFAYDLVLDGSGGTTLTAYSRITDQVCSATIPFAITAPATELYVLEQGLVINDTAGGTVYAYSALGDLMSQHTWPMASMPSHFNIGCPPERFLATGNPFMLNSLVVGTVRSTGIPFPPALGSLYMALVPSPRLSPIGVMGPDGVIGYSLDIPGIVPRQSYFLQSINIDPNVPQGQSVSWGESLYVFQIH